MRSIKLVCLSLLTFSVLSSNSVYAYSDIDGSIDNTDNIAWDAYDPLSWNQFRSEDMPKSWLGDKMLDGSSGVSFPEGGDLIYVYTFLAIKTGHKMAGYLPSYANADLEYYHAYANGLPHFGAEGIWSKGWKADLEDNGSQIQKGVTLDSARKSFLDGKLVVLQVKNSNYTEETPYTHFIAIDSVEEDNSVKIFDSFQPGAEFSDSYKSSDIVGMITLSSSEESATDLPKLWERRGYEDVFSEDGSRDPATLGGGGAKHEGKAEKYESTQTSSSNQSLGTYTPRDDAPNKFEKGNKVTNKKNSSSGFSIWNVLAAILGILIPAGGFVYAWVRRKNQDTY